MHNLAERKQELIQEVSQISDEQEFAQLEETLRKIKARQERIRKYRRPMPKKTDPEAIKRQRGFKGHDKEAFMHLIREMNVQEPVEELLAMLTK
ncbi:MAG: hypothetical protein KIS77_06820 [Saprospiraceae bacterium]|nr:hypothetical protein [Saprospiraceae bacterium]